MGHVEPVGSAQRHVPLRHDPVLVVYVVARVAMRERQPVRHVRVRQGRIVPHDLVVDHRDLHALARQSGIPRVAHAHVLDAPVDRPVRHSRQDVNADTIPGNRPRRPNRTITAPPLLGRRRTGGHRPAVRRGLIQRDDFRHPGCRSMSGGIRGRRRRHLGLGVIDGIHL